MRMSKCRAREAILFDSTLYSGAGPIDFRVLSRGVEFEESGFCRISALGMKLPEWAMGVERTSVLGN